MSAPRFRLDPLSESFVRLIDIMFGLTITQGFVIYRDNITTPSLSVENISLLLVYSTIVLSWIGYHGSILRYPYNKSRWSRIRLLLDIVILVLYSYLVFVSRDLSKVFLGISIVFLVYAINGIVRILEWGRDRKVSAPWLSAIFMVIFLFFCFNNRWLEDFLAPVYVEWLLLVLGLVLVFVYRLIRGSSKIGYPTLVVVGVDVDGVLAEQVPPVLQKLQSKGIGIGLTKDDIIDWNYRIDDKLDISDAIEEDLLDPNFTREMPVVQGSTSVMKTLHGKYHIVIATSRPLKTQKETIEWLKKNFKFHEFVSTREIGKGNIELDVLIDDNLGNVKDFATRNKFAILFSQPWNSDVKDQDMLGLLREKKVVRCKSWEEVLEALKNNRNISSSGYRKHFSLPSKR